MELTWKGTASLVLSSGDNKILFDPFVPWKGSPVATTIEDFDGYDTVFVTHGHMDHIYSLPEIFKRNPGMKIYCTKSPYDILLKRGIDKNALVLIGNNETYEIGDITIQTFHGKHAVLPKASIKRLKYIIASKARMNFFPFMWEMHVSKENEETLFFHVSCEGKTIDIMGSMNLIDDVEYPTGSDVLILPYAGWEDNFSPAVKCIERLKPKKIYLDHFDDTFPPFTMYIDLAPIKEKYPGLVTELKHDRTISI